MDYLKLVIEFFLDVFRVSVSSGFYYIFGLFLLSSIVLIILFRFIRGIIRLW